MVGRELLLGPVAGFRNLNPSLKATDLMVYRKKQTFGHIHESEMKAITMIDGFIV